MPRLCRAVSSTLVDPRCGHRGARLSVDCTGRDGSTRAALLALSVLADSAIEHYRGSFDNPRDVLAARRRHAHARRQPAWRAASARSSASRLRTRDLSALAAVDRARGHGLPSLQRHEAPGRLALAQPVLRARRSARRWHCCSPARSAPSPSGCATRPDDRRNVFGMPAGRALGCWSARGLLGTVGEVALLHFRGAFQQPVRCMLPVIVPPLAAALLAQAALGAPTRALVRRGWWLRTDGAARLRRRRLPRLRHCARMGGWRNWSQNLLERAAAARAAELYRRWRWPGSPRSTLMRANESRMSDDRYPGYDVLTKRDTPSWNEQTRAVIDARLAHRRANRISLRDASGRR